MNWFKRAWTWVRRLPVAAYIKPLWKGLLAELVQEEGDALQKRLKVLVSQEGHSAIDHLIDDWQGRLKRRIEPLPLPLGIERRLLDAIQVQGDNLQGALTAAVVKGGPGAVDAAFDAAQEALRGHIAAL